MRFNILNKAFKSIHMFLIWMRYKELLLLLSPGFMGMMLAPYSIFNALHDGKLQFILLSFLATYFGGAHVFLFNLWAGITLNKRDASAIDYPLKPEEIDKKLILVCSFIFLCISFVIYYCLNITIFILSIIIAGLWMLYAVPRVLLKSSYLGGILVHFINGNLHVLIGYLLFNPWNVRGIIISNYFALIFLAGYFHHILKDRETDRAMNIATLATRYNPRTIFIIGNLLFLASYVYLGILSLYKIVPAAFIILNTFVMAGLCIYFVKLIRTDLSKEKIVHYRSFYRLLYCLFGMGTGVCKFVNL